MEKEDSNKLGETIYKARESQGISSRALAERIGVHHSYIARVQLGEYRQVAPDILAKLATELDLRLADLYSLAGYSLPEELPSFEGFLHTQYRSLPTEDVQALRSHLDYLVQKNESGSEDSDRIEATK
ncbi:MAG: helix-turn-helix transcriptional regulator [Actinomycetota bacterium]